MGIQGTYCKFLRALFQVRDVILMIMVRFVQTFQSVRKVLIHAEVNVTKKKRGGKYCVVGGPNFDGCKMENVRKESTSFQIKPRMAKDIGYEYALCKAGRDINRP